MGVASSINRICNLTANTLVAWLLQPPPPSAMFPETLECFADVSVRMELHTLCFEWLWVSVVASVAKGSKFPW